MLFPWDSCSFTSFFFVREFHASLLCFLGWFSSLRSGGLVFDFFSFYDSHCSWWAFFFFHHNLHYFGFFGSVVVSFLDFFSVVSLFRVSFIERAGWSSVRRSTKELVSYLLAGTEAFLFWCSVTVLAWCSSLSLFFLSLLFHFNLLIFSFNCFLPAAP